MNRRIFLTLAGACLEVGQLGAIEPFARKGEPRLLLGLAAYSFRQQMRWMKGKPNPELNGAEAWDLFSFIDYCADHGCAGAELTSYFFPPKFGPDYLLKLKRHAYLRGVAISGTAVGNVFTHPEGPARRKEITYVNDWIRHAAVMGAPHIRVFAGNAPKGMSQEEAEKNFLECYTECLDLAAEKGIFLGLENHGGIVSEADALVRIMKAVDSPWAGINLDSGNFHTDDPYGDLAKIAPYAVNVQMKIELHKKGADQPEAMNVPKLLNILHEASYHGWFILEYEGSEDAEASVPQILKTLATHL
ncbi:MAG: sugar phosphate isomerase/epimerase family protein [Akkermansiaceae bacterium]|jgi:sugar phosphate isomerase/epimerase